LTLKTKYDTLVVVNFIFKKKKSTEQNSKEIGNLNFDVSKFKESQKQKDTTLLDNYLADHKRLLQDELRVFKSSLDSQVPIFLNLEF